MPRWLLALAHSWTARETDTLEVLADVKSFTPRTLRFEGHLFDNEGFGSFSRVVPRMRGLEELLLRNAGSGVFTDIAPPPPPFQAVRIGSVEIVDVRDLRAWDVDRARRSWMRNPPLRFVVDDHVDFHMHSLSTAADVRKGLEMVSFLRELGMLDGPEIRGLTELEELAAWDV
ncbi:hypothetical protein DFJ74DRAFT_640674 [Hyaloraphidium curvatum]|nr:hypothetical protein DFJ74DRAFT_640674 [Hyaloraphidium curvatum]